MTLQDGRPVAHTVRATLLVRRTRHNRPSTQVARDMAGHTRIGRATRSTARSIECITHSATQRDTVRVHTIEDMGALQAPSRDTVVATRASVATKDQFWRKKNKKMEYKIFIYFFALFPVLNVKAGWCLVGLKSQFKGL